MSSFIPQLSSLAALQFQSFNMSGAMANETSIESDTLFTAMYNFYSFLLTSPAFRDGARLFLLGGSIESARRLLNFAWAHFIDSFFLTAEFEERDESFSKLLPPFQMSSNHLQNIHSMDYVLVVQAAVME